MFDDIALIVLLLFCGVAAIVGRKTPGAFEDGDPRKASANRRAMLWLGVALLFGAACYMARVVYRLMA